MKHFLTSYSPTRVLRLLSVAALIAGMVFGAGPAPAVRADATLTVNSTADLTDLVPGNGVCDADPGPATVCTLRAAIQESNGMAGNDTIIVPSGIYTLTIAGFSEEFSATGDFDLRDNVIISGAGAATTIIDGGGLDRVFDLGDAFLTTVISATLSNMTIQNGLSTSDGGGVVNAGQVLTVTNSAIINNTAPGDGGGLANISASGVTIITNSTVSGNSSSADGGGFSNSGVMTVTNSTISGNTANLNGGGIRNISTLALINVTIASNSGGSGGGFGGGLYNTLGTATLTNSLIADSTLGADCANSGTLVNGGNNIVKDDSCLPGGGDPNLGPLQDNGGPTKTHALLSPSTAIDGGNNANCPSADQRGIARPQGPTCDVGAFEAEYNDAPVNGVPGSQTMDEDTTQVFSSGGGNALSVSDVDAGSNAVQTTLTGTNGVMTLAGTSGLTFSVGDGTADATMTFTGTVSAITAALNGLSFAPPANYYGAASVQITTNDLGNTGLGGAQSDSDTVAITVTAVNDSPTISDIANQSTDAGVPTSAVAFTIGDVETPASSLTITGTSSNLALVPNANIVFGGAAANRTVTVTPLPGQAGTTTITVTVSDGTDTATDTFVLTVVFRLFLPIVLRP
jgi:CSLREA domain-containing protein